MWTAFYYLEPFSPDDKDGRCGVINAGGNLEIVDPKDKLKWTTRRFKNGNWTYNDFPGARRRRS